MSAGCRATVLREETVLVQTSVKDKEQDGMGRENDTFKYPRAENREDIFTRARETREIHHCQG